MSGKTTMTTNNSTMILSRACGLEICGSIYLGEQEKNRDYKGNVNLNFTEPVIA